MLYAVHGLALLGKTLYLTLYGSKYDEYYSAHGAAFYSYKVTYFHELTSVCL